MKILTIRSDKPEAEIGLFDSEKQLDYEVWTADRELSLTILGKIKELLKKNNIDFSDLQGIIGYKGPGSFTGLRIGLTVANTLAYGLKVPIVGSDAEAWIQDGVSRLNSGDDERIVQPGYGRAPNVTKPKK
jgi:tRNA threonylcarbamoyladenosine biosynthesis protein TsaB